MANNDYDFEFEEQDTGSTPKKSKKKAKPQNRFVRFLLTLFWCMVMVAASLFLAYFALSSASDLLGINQVDEQIEITIPEDAKGSIGKVSKILSDTGVIDQPLTFQLYAKLRHMDGSDRGEGKAPRLFLPGTYVVNSRWGYDNLMNYLSYERTEESQLDVVTVTISEGMTVVQIAQKLEENKVCSAEDFYEALNGEFDYAFLERIPEDERFRKLEGYLFPDTYEFYVGENAASVVRRFLNNFQNRWTTEYQTQADALGVSIDEAIVMASILQAEAATSSQMPEISSVLYNRLAKPSVFPKIECDSTEKYLLETIKPTLTSTTEDIQKYISYRDNYDTYSDACTGLPVGAIGNPGDAAIRAALFPADTNYYYFRHDDDGKIYYANSLSEHEENGRKIARSSAD